jgi:hypothetical protein
MQTSKGGETASSNGESSAKAQLLTINNLTYRLDPDLSVAVAVTDKNHYFQMQEMQNTQAGICVFNSGADYIDTRRSTLDFTIVLPSDVSYGLRLKAWGERKDDGKINMPNVLVNKDHGDAAAKEDAVGLYWPETISFGKPNAEGGFNGSALNVIDSITVSSRSGDELARSDKANLLSYIKQNWQRDKQWADTVGSAMGFNRAFRINNIADESKVSFATKWPYNRSYYNESYRYEMRVSIPMYCLCGLFNFDRLMPSMLMAGMRVEIRWATPQTAFVRGDVWKTHSEKYLSPVHLAGASGVSPASNGCFFNINSLDANSSNDLEFVADSVGDLSNNNGKAGISFRSYYPFSEASTSYVTLKTDAPEIDEKLRIHSYQIRDIRFVLKSVQLTDVAQRILNEHSAVNGLEIVYSDYSLTHYTPYGGSTVNFEVRQAASRALKCVLHVRYKQQPNSQTVDSFAPTYNHFTKHHWRLGSLYFPHQPVQSPTAHENANASYVYSLDAFGKFGAGPRAKATYKNFLAPHQFDEVDVDDAPGAISPDTKWTSAYHVTGLPNASFNCEYQSHLINFLTDACDYAVSLERSTLFNLSGIPINNSRVLSFNGTFHDCSVGNSTEKVNDNYGGMFECDLFLQYVRCARVFLSNVEVEQ